MGGVPKHQVTQMCSRLRADDLSAETVVPEFGQHTRVVYVRMGQKDIIDI